MRRLLWISGREVGKDLASTTELSICNSIAKQNIGVTLVSPGEIDVTLFDHFSVKKTNFPGLNTISGSRHIKNEIWDKLGIHDYQKLLVDWRYVIPLRSKLLACPIPWFIVDRGPPAYPGILAGLQHKFWSRGWKFADSHSGGGLVVSENHAEYIRSDLGVNLNLTPVPAGCSINEYLDIKSDPSEELKLVYVGRIDRNRGIMELENLSKNLSDLGVKYRIIVAGAGDLEDWMFNFSFLSDNTDFLGRVDNHRINKILAESHIGIMPMPNFPIWRISSPLKLAEYLASGLAIIGPKHDGNKLSPSGKWDLLTEDGRWSDVENAGWLPNYISNWKEISKDALRSSKYLDWDRISSELVSKLFLVQ